MIALKKFFNVIVTLCIGLLLGSATNAFAAINNVVEAQISKFMIIVDGQEQKLEADPLVVNGSAYVPLRVFANMLGKDVIYKADSRTIELNTPMDESKGAKINMTDFTVYTPDDIFGQITAMKAELRRTTDTKMISDLELRISEREAYLKQIGWEYKAPPSELELQLAEVNRKINVATDMLNSTAQHEELMNDPATKNLEKILEDLQAEKAALEAQIEELNTQKTMVEDQ